MSHEFTKKEVIIRRVWLDFGLFFIVSIGHNFSKIVWRNKNKLLNMKAIFEVMNTTSAVVKVKPEKNQACTGFEPMTFANRCSTLLPELTSQLRASYTKPREVMNTWLWICENLIYFTTAQVVLITAKMAFILTSLPAVHIYDFHIFTVI